MRTFSALLDLSETLLSGWLMHHKKFSLRTHRIPFYLAALSLAIAGSAVAQVNGGKQAPNSALTATERAALTFPESFLAGSHGEQNAIQNLLLRIQQVEKEYNQTLDDAGSFSGIYVIGDATTAVDSGKQGYSYGLEWDLYDQGRYEAKRKLSEKKLQTRLQFLQLMRQMLDRRKEEKIFYLNRLQGRIALFKNQRLEAFAAQHLALLKQQLNKGFATQAEFDEWQYRVASARNALKFQQDEASVAISPELRSTLNGIDDWRLKPADDLLNTALQRSYALKIQQVFIQRSQFFPEWKDNLRVRLFVEQRRFRGGPTDEVAGVRFRVPLGGNAKRDHIIALDQNAYRQQAGAIRERIRQRLEYLRHQLQLQQHRVGDLIQEYRLVGSKIELAQRYQAASIPTLSYTPEKQIALLKLQQIEVADKALLARLTIVQTATELQQLVLTPQINDLFQFD